MISRKKIISHSQSDLESKYNPYEVEDDMWYNVEKLYQIWGKVIVMERNRRVAKAYSRVPVLSINGSEDGFDGYKIGLNGFDNPMRDAPTKTVKRHIGKGIRLKMDDSGNIIVKRVSNCDVFIRGWDKDSNSVSEDLIELSGELEFDKSIKLFDMKKFKSNMAHELRSAYPDRRKLESQCICAIAFVKDTPDLLDLCSWILLINIVALDLLKTRFPIGSADRYGLSNDLLSLPKVPKLVKIMDPPQLPPGPGHQQHRSRDLPDKVTTEHPKSTGNSNSHYRKISTLLPPKNQKMRKSQSTSSISYLNSSLKFSVGPSVYGGERNSFYPGSNQYSTDSSDPYTSIKTSSDEIYGGIYGHLGTGTGSSGTGSSGLSRASRFANTLGRSPMMSYNYSMPYLTQPKNRNNMNRYAHNWDISLS